MTFNHQTTVFAVELKPSQQLSHVLTVIHLIAVVACFANAIPLILKITINVLVILNFITTSKKLKMDVRKIKHSEQRGWEISAGGDFKAVTILRSTVITPFCIFLHVKNDSPLLIAKDALCEDEFKQLVVKLKMHV